MRKLILVFIFLLFVTSSQAVAVRFVELETNFGDIVIELNEDAAPVTVDNFLAYVSSGFYDGLIFHRVVKDSPDPFVIQAGAYDVDMYYHDPCDPIINESNNGLSNLRGTIAMAMTLDPNSATSQFYINYEDNTYLDYKDANDVGYCVFGRVVSDMNVIDTITQTPTEDNVPTSKPSILDDVPINPVVIFTAKVLGDFDEDSEVDFSDYSILADRWLTGGSSGPAKLTASDAEAGDCFGYSVSVSADCAIMGAPGDVPYASNAGCAYIFECNDASWAQRARLTADDGSAGDLFGFSVSASADYHYAIIAAPGANDCRGSAYIFEYNDANWVQSATLTASDGAADDWFGNSVSISGGYAIVGAINDNNKCGSAYIFERNDANWVQQAKLTADDAADGDKFGMRVSIWRDYAIVGAWLNDANGAADAGSAYVFKRGDTGWTQQAKLTASDGSDGDRFGFSVSISADYAIVSAIGDDPNGNYSGSAYVFERNDANWVQQAKLTASDAAAGDKFGYSVSISGDCAAVGAHWDDDNGADSGSVYIFRRSGDNWTQQDKLTAADGADGDSFGFSVSVDNNYALAGAYANDAGGKDSGSAYMYRLCPDADFNGDCVVDYADLAVFADNWLIPLP